MFPHRRLRSRRRHRSQLRLLPLARWLCSVVMVMAVMAMVVMHLVMAVVATVMGAPGHPLSLLFKLRLRH